MRAVDLIADKRAGRRHEPAEIGWLIGAYLAGEVPDYQVAAWLMAVCWRGLDAGETHALTMALAGSGRRLDFTDFPVPVVDKHSTGGVGDKTTLVLAPMLAAAGVAVAKMSGRGLGHTGGTIDKLEAIPGVRLTADADELVAAVRAHRLAIAVQSPQLAPGDGRLYALRDVTATVESIPLIASSVMSKKIATGAQSVVLDVKAGSGAFMQDRAAARQLAATMVALGKAAGLSVVAVISNMDQPLGHAIGNALEVGEALETLQGRGPDDLRRLCLALGAELLVAAGVARDARAASRRLAATIDDRTALQAFLDLTDRLGGDGGTLLRPAGLPVAPVRLVIPAPRTGYVAGVDALACGRVAMHLGAGRTTKDAPIDSAAGLVLHAKTGDHVRQGAPLVTLHTQRALSVDSEPARAALAAFRWAAAPVPRPPLLYEVRRPVGRTPTTER